MGETQERQLQEEFGELRKWVEGLPPMVDRPYLVFVPCGDPVLNVLPSFSQRECHPDERSSNRVGRFAGYLHR